MGRALAKPIRRIGQEDGFLKSSPHPTTEALRQTHQRTLWLGTMKAVLPGGFEPPRKNHQAATIRMSKARTAIRSICLGSWPPWLIFQRIVFDLRNEALDQCGCSAAVPRHNSSARFA